MKKFIQIYLAALLLLVIWGWPCYSQDNQGGLTQVTIEGNKWHINGAISNPGSPAEGLLMNVRMVNAVFEDRGEGWKKQVDTFDPEENTQTFIHRIPEYVDLGVNAFVISLQGGLPGYEGAINTAFEPSGNLRKSYFDRVAKVISAADEHGAAIILSWGEKDDLEVYKMFKNMTTPGFQLDKELLEQPSVTIIYPNDGSVFMEGSPLTINYSHLFQDPSIDSKVVLTVNDKQILLENNQKRLEWKPEAAGPYYLRIVVYDEEGQPMYRSAPVDIEVSPVRE